MSNKNYQIAKFYARLYELREIINNEIVPGGIHIGAQTEDHKLFESLEILANDIDEHLRSYELKVEIKNVFTTRFG